MGDSTVRAGQPRGGMTEKEIKEALRVAYVKRARLNEWIDELAERLKAISPEYRKIMEQIEG